MGWKWIKDWCTKHTVLDLFNHIFYSFKNIFTKKTKLFLNYSHIRIEKAYNFAK